MLGRLTGQSIFYHVKDPRDRFESENSEYIEATLI